MSHLDSLESRYNGLAEVQLIGTTYEGNPIKGLKVRKLFFFQIAKEKLKYVFHSKEIMQKIFVYLNTKPKSCRNFLCNLFCLNSGICSLLSSGSKVRKELYLDFVNFTRKCIIRYCSGLFFR